MTKKYWKLMATAGVVGFLLALLCLALLQLSFWFSLTPFAVNRGEGLQARGERKTGLVLVAGSDCALSSLYPMANAAFQNRLPVLLLAFSEGSQEQHAASLSQALQDWEEKTGIALDGVLLLVQGDAAAPALMLMNDEAFSIGGMVFVSPKLNIDDLETARTEERFPILLAGNAEQSGEVLTELFNGMTGSKLLTMGGAYQSTKGAITVQTIVQNPPFEFSSPGVAQVLNRWYGLNFSGQAIFSGWVLVLINSVWILLPVFAAIAMIGAGGCASLKEEGTTELLIANQSGAVRKLIYRGLLWLLSLPCIGVLFLLFGLAHTGLGLTLTFCAVMLGSYGVTGIALAKFSKAHTVLAFQHPLRRSVQRHKRLKGILLAAVFLAGFLFAALTGLPVRSLVWRQLMWLVPVFVLMGFGYYTYLLEDELLFERQAGLTVRGAYLLLQLVPFLLLGLFWLFSGAHPQLFAALLALMWWGVCMLLGRMVGRFCSCIPAGAGVAALSFSVGLAALAIA